MVPRSFCYNSWIMNEGSALSMIGISSALFILISATLALQ
jgi:hypothetical protein